MSYPILFIHGGAGRKDKDPKRIEKIRKKVPSILSASYPQLINSNALDAVVLAVQLLENDPDFNAGTGSRLQSDGEARLSASIMDGKKTIKLGHFK